jgi:hypothetical protein
MNNLLNLDKNYISNPKETPNPTDSMANFDNLRKGIIKEVIAVTESIINTFQFKMIYSSKVSKQQDEKAEKLVKDYRKKNWEAALKKANGNKDKAYGIYISDIKGIF